MKIAFIRFFTVLLLSISAARSIRTSIQKTGKSTNDILPINKDAPDFKNSKASLDMDSNTYSDKTTKTMNSLTEVSTNNKEEKGFFGNIDSVLIEKRHQMQKYASKIGDEFVIIAESANPRIRALCIFIFASLTVTFFCFALQYILANAKEAQRHLTLIEKQIHRRLQQESLVQQYASSAHPDNEDNKILTQDASV